MAKKNTNTNATAKPINAPKPKQATATGEYVPRTVLGITVPVIAGNLLELTISQRTYKEVAKGIFEGLHAELFSVGSRIASNVPDTYLTVFKSGNTTLTVSTKEAVSYCLVNACRPLMSGIKAGSDSIDASLVAAKNGEKQNASANDTYCDANAVWQVNAQDKAGEALAIARLAYGLAKMVVAGDNLTAATDAQAQSVGRGLLVDLASKLTGGSVKGEQALPLALALTEVAVFGIAGQRIAVEIKRLKDALNAEATKTSIRITAEKAFASQAAREATAEAAHEAAGVKQ